MTQSRTRFRGFWGKISLPVQVIRNTRLATGETDGSQDSGIYYTLKKNKEGGSYVKVSWADFTPKHEGFNTQA